MSTPYRRHLIRSIEPLFLATIVTSLAFNYARNKRSRAEESRLNALRIHSLREMLAEERAAPVSLGVQRLERERDLARRMLRLGLDPGSVGVSPEVCEEQRSLFHFQGPQDVAWSEALFGKPGQAASGIRRAGRAAWERLGSLKASVSKPKSESLPADGVDKTLSGDEDWTDAQWEQVLLAAAEDASTARAVNPFTAIQRADAGHTPEDLAEASERDVASARRARQEALRPYAGTEPSVPSKALPTSTPARDQSPAAQQSFAQPSQLSSSSPSSDVPSSAAPPPPPSSGSRRRVYV